MKRAKIIGVFKKEQQKNDGINSSIALKKKKEKKRTRGCSLCETILDEFDITLFRILRPNHPNHGLDKVKSSNQVYSNSNIKTKQTFANEMRKPETENSRVLLRDPNKSGDLNTTYVSMISTIAEFTFRRHDNEKTFARSSSNFTHKRRRLMQVPQHFSVRNKKKKALILKRRYILTSKKEPTILRFCEIKVSDRATRQVFHSETYGCKNIIIPAYAKLFLPLSFPIRTLVPGRLCQFNVIVVRVPMKV
ncbi:hypothetical protein WN51_02231 [Melipona quadrifasciata]|uniref:Uncharacterized protein n=1 Tax=Melipona quadrifasciata TaxID=166423 RepID=A0A0M8ZTU1_9HYME|nr:hypothetical protein WN51_02231 [Melipona quadrifasciata]